MDEATKLLTHSQTHIMWLELSEKMEVKEIWKLIQLKFKNANYLIEEGENLAEF